MEFLKAYDLNEGFVYVDDIEKWQLCYVKNVTGNENELRATAICYNENFTQVNRVVKLVKEEIEGFKSCEILKDGCIYIYNIVEFFDSREDEENEEDFKVILKKDYIDMYGYSMQE